MYAIRSYYAASLSPAQNGSSNARSILSPASSTLRRLLELDFTGLTYPETTILATTGFRFEDPNLRGDWN